MRPPRTDTGQKGSSEDQNWAVDHAKKIIDLTTYKIKLCFTLSWPKACCSVSLAEDLQEQYGHKYDKHNRHEADPHDRRDKSVSAVWTNA
jgi:hypothetical protein